jgi:hypothetical protein
MCMRPLQLCWFTIVLVYSLLTATTSQHRSYFMPLLPANKGILAVIATPLAVAVSGCIYDLVSKYCETIIII